MTINFKNLLILLTLVFSMWKTSFSQDNQLGVGTQFPLFYTLSYEEKIMNNLHLGVQFGWLQKPFSTIIIKEAKRRDLDNELGTIIQNNFEAGYSFQAFLKYKFKYFHIGLMHSIVQLKASDLPYQKIADIYNIDLSPFGDLSQLSSFINNIELLSTIQMPGIFVGKELDIKKTNFKIGIEIGFQKIISSENQLTYGSGGTLPLVSTRANNDLNGYYKKEGNIPSFNLYFIYRFNKSLNGLVKRINNKE